MAAITVAAGVACAVSGNLWIAGALVAAAVAVAAVPVGHAVSPDELKLLLESLRVAQKTGAPAVKAVVMPRIILIAKAAGADTSSSRYALLFRDEMDVADWRELSTLLRHQAHHSPERKKLEQFTP